MKRPLGVSLISYFYIFGSIVLIFTAIFYDANANSIGIAERFGMPNVPERFMRAIVALFSLGMIYGYMRLKLWGFWLMVIYSVLFGLISSSLTINFQHLAFRNVIWSIVVLVYTLYVKKSFFKADGVSDNVKVDH